MKWFKVCYYWNFTLQNLHKMDLRNSPGQALWWLGITCMASKGQRQRCAGMPHWGLWGEPAICWEHTGCVCLHTPPRRSAWPWHLSLPVSGHALQCCLCLQGNTLAIRLLRYWETFQQNLKIYTEYIIPLKTLCPLTNLSPFPHATLEPCQLGVGHAWLFHDT